jgi:glycosyltransferase involved in cell wall biosynthesis
MPRLLIANDYPLRGLIAQVKAGEVPDQLLYGVNHFMSAGWEVDHVDLAERPPGKLIRLLNRLLPLGDLHKQLQIVRRREPYDLLYVPCQTQTQLLHHARRLRWFRKPMVILAHHPVAPGRLHGLRRKHLCWQARGSDAFPALSRVVAKEINGLVPDRSRPLHWGPDLEFYRPSAQQGTGILTAGRTRRDLLTFGRAATIAGAPATIVCLESDVSPEFSSFGPNVSVIVRPRSQWMSYRELTRMMSSSLAVAIPLMDHPWLCGLSSLADAMGLGLPVIMTRNRCIDIDVEREGIGHWVNPGSVDEWVNAIRHLTSHPAEARAMGQRSLALARNHYNSGLFAQEMMAIFEQTLGAQVRTARQSGPL